MGDDGRRARPEAVAAVAQAAMPLGSEAADAALRELVGDARLVLLGEATHGTREFSAERARITRRLIEAGGVCAVALEADWPDAHRLDRFVRGRGDEADADAALGAVTRFPRWMWRNTVVPEFATGLRGHNAGRPASERAGVYGLDYRLHRSVRACSTTSSGPIPRRRRARERCSCVEHVGADGQSYGAAVESGALVPCEDAVVQQLAELRGTSAEAARIAVGHGEVAESNRGECDGRDGHGRDR